MLTSEEIKLDSIIYPHSVTLSAEPVKANSLYSVFDKSLFSIYLSIFSLEKEKDYRVYLSIIDLLGYVQPTLMDKNFETLDCEDYNYFMKSIFLVFQPFKRRVLNFDVDKDMKLQKFYITVQEWLEDFKEEQEK
jgi:hypothetical protein